ncbi:MAG: hypothetical protein H0X66_09715 [Verrucomicrobia bacterium]|nr:hypothetical protein [Verrucomicrobiota bacterium]
MSQTATPEPKPWQPFTPRGVARFTRASTNRLIIVQLISALIVAACVVWFLAVCYSPVILGAFQKLPDDAKISQQQLQGLQPGALAENRFLSIGVESVDNPFAGIGDLQIRMGSTELKLCSLIGCVEIPYPAGWTISLARKSVEPRWGAWEPMLLAGTGLFTMLKLVVSWGVLGLIYMWVPKLIAFYADRELNGFDSWKLACAAQLPGAFFAAGAILLYGSGALDLIRFLILYALHIPVGWIYLVIAPFLLPKLPGILPKLSGKKVKKNPFKK